MVFCSSMHTRLTRTSSDLRILSAVLPPPSPILKASDFLASSTSGEIPILVGATTFVLDSPSISAELQLSPTGDKTQMTTDDVPDSNGGRHAESPNDLFSVGRNSDELKDAYYEFLGFTGADGCSLPRVTGKLVDFRESQDSLGSPVAVPREDVEDQLPMIASFYTYSTLPTPTFAPPSPSPSADTISPFSSPTNRQRHRRPLERARAVRFPGRPRSPRLQNSEAEVYDRCSKASPSPTRRAHPGRQVVDSSSVVPSRQCKYGAFIKHITLPEELPWLDRMMIELWIDQEGFRAIRPCMQLIGYSPRTRSLHPYESFENASPDTTAGVAEFMPTKRETFIFHYATLDGPPTLRMVSVTGDNSRDYISRQATLSVKLNGVYTVLGTETFMATTLNSDTHRIQNMRLRWKFDYLVSDRQVDGTGRILPGEKTLTPLTFSCSPYLFHPLQGKKAGLMHIMKKNLVPKLGSRKLEPPTRYPSGHLPGTATLRTRSHSDAFNKGGYHPFTRPPLDTGRFIRGVNREQCARRRRASSAGEDGLACLMRNPECTAFHSGC